MPDADVDTAAIRELHTAALVPVNPSWWTLPPWAVRCFGKLDLLPGTDRLFVNLKSKQQSSLLLQPAWLLKTGVHALALPTACALLPKCKYYHTHVHTPEPRHREHLVRTTASIPYQVTTQQSPLLPKR